MVIEFVTIHMMNMRPFWEFAAQCLFRDPNMNGLNDATMHNAKVSSTITHVSPNYHNFRVDCCRGAT